MSSSRDADVWFGGRTGPIWALAFSACACLFLVCYLVRERHDLDRVRRIEKAAAIVLLAGAGEERAPLAASLYRAGYAPLILLTDDGVRRGWSREHDRNLYSIEMTENELVRRGVPRGAMVRLPFRRSGTVHDAVAVREYLSSHPPADIIIVTSDYHAARALSIFGDVLAPMPHRIGVAAATSARFAPLATAQELAKTLFYLLYYRLPDNIPRST